MCDTSVALPAGEPAGDEGIGLVVGSHLVTARVHESAGLAPQEVASADVPLVFVLNAKVEVVGPCSY